MRARNKLVTTKIGWLLGRLLLDGLTAGITQAVLPPVPTLERGITAEAGDEINIRGGYGGRLFSVCSTLTHTCPQ